ncbi:hypothetical protein HZA42_04480 [Candidatus Peregrinibacteria bacterium]|nr:hypothetical protein [Candidatus Peregrinibacteria bacterium]
MRIIPAIYLSGSKVVTQYKAQKESEEILSGDPLKSARWFEKHGAKALHVVGTDGSEANRKVAVLIAKNTKLAVSYADGVLSQEIIEELLAAGIAQVSLDQFCENLLAEALQKFGPGKITFTIKAKRNLVESKPNLDVMDYGKDLVDKGVTQIIFRDTKSEGTFHPNYDEVEKLVLNTTAKIFSFGGVGKMSDLEVLAKTGAYAAIISKAFFENKLSVKECVAKFEG